MKYNKKKFTRNWFRNPKIFKKGSLKVVDIRKTNFKGKKLPKRNSKAIIDIVRKTNKKSTHSILTLKKKK